MIKIIVSTLELRLDKRIGVRELLYDKYDKAVLVENDLSDSFHFPDMKHDLYTESVTKEDVSAIIKLKTNFRGSHWFALLNLRRFPVFETTLVAMQCILLVRRMHGGSL